MLEFSSSGANIFATASVSAVSSAAVMNPNQANASLSGSSLLAQFGRSNSVSSGSSMFSLLGSTGAGIGPPPLDMNEFPSLGGSSIASFAQTAITGFTQTANTGRQPYVGLLKDNVTANTVPNEFNIQSEDFPALPGAPAGGGGGGQPSSQSNTPNSASLQAALHASFGGTPGSDVVVNPLALTQQLSAAAGVIGSSSHGGNTSNQSSGGHSANSGNNPSAQHNSSNTRPDSTDSSQATQSSGNSGVNNISSQGGNSGSAGSAKKWAGVQLTADGHLANIPPGMLTDQYGMAGLVALLANTENNQSLFSLAIGYDIASINLNLNSKERIYQTYPGPWNEKQLKPYEIDYPVPSEYLIHHNIRDKIADIKTNLYSDDLLFFLFYFFAGEQMQLLATNELHARDWRYHKDECVWIRRQGTALQEKSNTYERGSYIYFDPHNWMKMQKEMTVEYDRLETNPAAAAGFQ